MGISQVYKVFSFPWWSFAAFKAHFRGFELRAEGWERWRGEKRRGGGEEEGQWARILNITYANIQIAKCWSFPHSAFRMEISQVCKAFSFPCWSFAAFKAHLSRFRACSKVKSSCAYRDFHPSYHLILIAFEYWSLYMQKHFGRVRKINSLLVRP